MLLTSGRDIAEQIWKLDNDRNIETFQLYRYAQNPNHAKGHCIIPEAPYQT